MARVFISYKRADKEKVFPLKDKIEAAIGEPCWIDLEGIESDAQFVNVIIKVLNDAYIVLFMYSNEHTKITNYEKDWTVRELYFAEDKNKRIVFVNIDKTPLSDYFKMMYALKQQIDATSEEAFEKLLRDLKKWLKVKVEPEAVEATPAIVKEPESKQEPEPEPKPESDEAMEATEQQEPESKQEPKPEPKPVGKEAYTEGLEYEFDDEKLTATVNGIGTAEDEKDINIPPVIEYNGRRYSVTEIGMHAFRERRGLVSITIPNSVTEIGEKAFGSCTHLTSLYIPHSVKEIGKQAFEDCKMLTSISIPNSITELRPFIFSDCYNLTSFTIPDSVKEIGEGAFDNCRKLTSVTIPKGVKKINGFTFFNCSNLTSVSIPDSVKKIENCAFNDCTSLRSITIPDGVAIIETGAFSGCSSIESVEISRKTVVYEDAFPKTCKVKRR